MVSVDNNKSLNGANIDLNSSFDYKLEGSTVPKNSNGITEYGFHDDYDQEHDQYNGGYTVLLNSDVTLTDGTVLKKGTDVTKYTTQTIDQDNGIVDIEFDQDFLTKVDFTNSEFGATAYLKMRRVKAGDVENKYVNSINNQAFNSNTVKTHTDEPKSETPKNETRLHLKQRRRKRRCHQRPVNNQYLRPYSQLLCRLLVNRRHHLKASNSCLRLVTIKTKHWL
ncbi:hypothetical protein LX03_08585 [Limosilactobacillus mucosae]|uniref:Cell surface antigen C-terminal domain-containing protein n=1 Tax=Limosilactobacillus mucosae TaxID=97478 RepID=A0A099YD10_LIMMU|nr:hypothetical protein LX03_08585 [Limosilactobacillus mucosae]